MLVRGVIRDSYSFLDFFNIYSSCFSSLSFFLFFSVDKNFHFFSKLHLSSCKLLFSFYNYFLFSYNSFISSLSFLFFSYESGTKFLLMHTFNSCQFNIYIFLLIVTSYFLCFHQDMTYYGKLKVAMDTFISLFTW